MCRRIPICECRLKIDSERLSAEREHVFGIHERCSGAAAAAGTKSYESFIKQFHCRWAVKNRILKAHRQQAVAAAGKESHLLVMAGSAYVGNPCGGKMSWEKACVRSF